MKKIFLALAVIMLATYAMAADDAGTVLPPGEINTNSEGTTPGGSWTYIQTIGTASGMDEYLWGDQDFCWTHTFGAYAPNLDLMDSKLEIRAEDVDWAAGERDKIYVEGRYVGYLGGASGVGFVTTFDDVLTKADLSDGMVEVCVDIDSTDSTGGPWAVQIDWSKMTVQYDYVASTPEPAIAVALIALTVPGMMYLIRKRT